MGNDASTQQAAALDQGGGTKAAGGGCCMCFLPNVAPYALLVECFLRASGVTSVRRVVAPPGKEVKAHAFDFVVAVSTPGFGAAYSWAKSVVPGNGNKPGVHVALRQSVLLLCVEPHCVHGIGDDSDAVTAVTKVVRLMEVVCVDGTSGLYLHGGICDSMKEVYHFLKQLAIPAQPVHNLIQRTSRGNFEIPSGDFQDGSVACFVATLYRWFSTCMCFKVVYYLTPLRQQRQIPWLPPIDVMLGNKGVPVPRTSVDLISLDLGWLVTLQDQHILVSDVYVEYPDVRDEFIDITEAFYFSLALGLKGETIQKIISEPPTSVEPLAPTKVGGEVPSSTELGKSTTTGNSPTTSLAPLPSISSNPLDLELKLETTPPEKPLGPPPQPPFQIQTADLDQVCFWLGSAGASDNCLKVIRANKLQGRTLVNLSKEQLCDLGVPVVDAEYIVEEILKKMMEDTGSQGNDQDTGQQCQEDQASPKTIVSPNPLCEGMSRVLSTELNYKCFAFVVGNESYPKLPLQNCIKDAKSVSKVYCLSTS
ncbi:hypothetical protein Pelo_5566 [Pelomyxa schiedti]|nr:hypothetical protein Pelo_5566 [Pelomyxa schiedti]